MSLDELKKFWNNKKDENSEMFISELKEKLIKGNIIPFIGAGMSKNFGYPDWNSLYNDINKEYGLKVEECNILEFGEKILNKLGGDESKLVELICRIFDKNKMHQIEEELNYLYYLTDNIKAIVTTNFDAVIEHYKPELEVCLPSNMLNNFSIEEKLRNGKKILIKLHGSYKERESIVITKKKFEQFYCEESALFKTVEFLWNNSYFLFMGCGLRKDHLIDKMKMMAKDNLHYHYAILEYPEENVEDRKRELLMMNIRPIWYEQKKHEQINAILQMILNVPAKNEPNEKKKEELKQISEKFDHMAHFDQLALKVINDEISQNKLVDAIFVQYNKNKSKFLLQNSTNSILDLMYAHIIKSIESDKKYPLSIEGEPGTGKSTILSLLYYKFYKEYKHDNNKTQPFLIDTHYYDKWKGNRNSAINDLNRLLSEIENQISQKSDKKFILFIDGINKYKRGDGKLQQQIDHLIRHIDKNNNIWFVASIGQDEEYQQLSKYPLYGCFNNKIVLSPVRNICECFSQLIKQTLIYYNSVNNKEISNDIINKFCDYITGLGGRETYFRTVRFIIEQYYHHIEQQHSKDFFKEDVGIIFNNYFTQVEGHNQKTILEIGKFIANKLFSTKQTKNTPKEIYYLYKSEPIKYYFLACYYISILISKSSKELKLIDHIFTHRINTFIIDLMNIEEDTEKEVVEGIQELMNNKETTLKQKNQFALLLGRIKKNDLKKIAKRILNNEYSKNVNNEDEDKDIRMYVRNIGMSLISLGVTEHENGFYNQFINNRFSSRINRNFYIQYFLKHKYYFEPNIDNDKNCTVDEINELYTKIYKSMFEKKEAKKEYFNINIIILLNLTIYKLFHLKKISEDEIKNTQELIKEILCLTSHTAINTNVLQYVKNIEIFINKIFNEKVFDLSIVKTIANIL